MYSPMMRNIGSKSESIGKTAFIPMLRTDLFTPKPLYNTEKAHAASRAV
jgi:hypothetical protein